MTTVIVFVAGMVLGVFLDRKSNGMLGDSLSGMKKKLQNMFNKQ